MSNKKLIAVIHFLPLESYPPIQNLLQDSKFLDEAIKVFCLTTKGDKMTYQNTKVNIYRLARLSSHKIKRLLVYLTFNLASLFILLSKRPRNILYYETLSVLPVYIYKKLRPSTKILIHYHEYVSLSEYSKSSYYIKFLHRLETELYKGASWISQTNEDRAAMFAEDYNIKTKKIKIVPNYPPSLWSDNFKKTKSRNSKKIKLVYVGYTLNNKSMFVNEILEIVNKNKNITIDFYLSKVPKEIQSSKIALVCGNRLNWNGSIEYNQIPLVITKYDVGIIIYKGISKNVIYCAPNKLFEYLSCGLDVWYSKQMKGIQKYRSKVVKELDFEKLALGHELPDLTNNKLKFSYSSEESNKELIKEILNIEN